MLQKAEAPTASSRRWAKLRAASTALSTYHWLQSANPLLVVEEVEVAVDPTAPPKSSCCCGCCTPGNFGLPLSPAAVTVLGFVAYTLLGFGLYAGLVIGLFFLLEAVCCNGLLLTWNLAVTATAVALVVALTGCCFGCFGTVCGWKEPIGRTQGLGTLPVRVPIELLNRDESIMTRRHVPREAPPC